MPKKKPLILVCNDDGVQSKGIRTLVDICEELGEVVVVAPDSPQSGMGHAITVANSIRLNKCRLFPDVDRAFECSGTPADCIKLAKHYVLKDVAPDLVVSGINHGSNSSVSVLYSGTMSAAIEAAIEGLPSIGFSLCDYDPEADFDHTVPWIRQIIKDALANTLPKHTALNVNIPAKNQGTIKGIKICRQAHARWVEDFDKRVDPYGRDYYWLVGEFHNLDKGEDTDIHWLKHNYISIVPCQFDMTAHHAISLINENFNLDGPGEA